MAFTTLNLGLTLTIPTNGTRNWGTTLLNTTWTRISQHAHTGSGDGNQITAAGLANNSITKVKLFQNQAWYQATTLTPLLISQTIDLNNGNIQKVNLGSATGDVTFAFTNPIEGGFYTVFIIQGATPRKVLWPGTVKWDTNQTPAVSVGNGDIDVAYLYYDGTNFYGHLENYATYAGKTSTPSGTTQTIDFRDGAIQNLNLGSATGDVTLTLSNPTSGKIHKLFVIQGAVARDIIWPAAVKWPQSQKPILSTGNGNIDVINLYFDGTNYYGDWDLNYA